MSREFAYSDAVSVLNRALKFGINPSLTPIQDMCAAMGAPQLRYQCVQVAGSNGKSSTTRMIAALLRAQGLKVGTYTSPHLDKYPERMEIDGEAVSKRAFADAIAASLDAAEKADVRATEFELLTAAALWLFACEGVEWAVLECGLGGRWDATSVVSPKVAVITGVALEHTQILGGTVEKIAAEKAAIIKSGSTAVLAHDVAASEVFEQQAREVGARVVRARPNSIDNYLDSIAHLPGYQRMNAATSLAAVQAALGHMPDAASIHAAFSTLVIPGRFEALREDPLLMIDAAHNPQSAEVLARELSQRFVVATAPEQIARAEAAAGKVPVPTLLLGVLADKDARGVVKALCPLFNRIVVTESKSPRAISAKKLSNMVAEVTGREPELVDSVPAALEYLADTPTIATGSITVAGEVKRVWC